MTIHQAEMPLSLGRYSQLLIIDAQERLAAAMPPDDLAKALSNIKRLVAAARTLEIPIIATEHNSKGLGNIIPAIREDLPGDVEPTEKTCFSCCTAAGFERNLDRQPDRKQVVMVGMEAHICILQTASGLRRWGYQVFVAEDAICSRHPAHRINAVERMRQGGIHVTNAESVVFEWLGDSTHERFREVWSLFRGT
jgi:nicotinamidase-related amidase